MDCYDLPSFNYFWNTEICVVPDAEGFCPPYQIVLDSDDGLFGGFSRLDHEAEYFTADWPHDNRPCSFSVYAPSRTAVVYALAEDE